MSLVWKFVLSYLFVVFIGLAVLSVSVAYVAPENFSQSVNSFMMRGMSGQQFEGSGANDGMGHGQFGGMMNNATPSSTDTQLTSDELNASFREAVNNALWKAGIAATGAAIVVGGLLSLYIIHPLRRMATASRYIAEGHYDQRLTERGNDAIGNLIRNFNRMAKALSEAETMRHQLIGDVSHELKTPLASIKGYMEGLQDGVIAPTPETFQLIHRETDRLQRLVYDIQELSHAEAALSQLDLRSCAAHELVGPVIAHLRPQFADKGIELECDIPPQLPRVTADIDRIGQVLTNLVGNALQYTPPGGRVTIRAAKTDRALQFSVQDTGVGLSPDNLSKVFQRFYRVDKSRSRIGGGSGIGLSIAQHLVEAHGGKIWAESAGLNQGSTFSFTLPLA